MNKAVPRFSHVCHIYNRPYRIHNLQSNDCVSKQEELLKTSTGSKIFADDFVQTCDHVIFQCKYDSLVAQRINTLYVC